MRWGARREMSEPLHKPWKDVLGTLDQYDPCAAGEMQLDPGIRRYVLILRAEGIETDQSCQGGPGHGHHEPMVRFYGNRYEGHKAFAIAMTYGLPVQSIRRSYAVHDGELQGPLWEMTFREADSVLRHTEAKP